MLRTILRGLEEIGIAMRNVIRAALDLARDTLIAVLRAVDALGRTLAQLLSTIAGAAFDLVKKAIDALLAIGKTIGNTHRAGRRHRRQPAPRHRPGADRSSARASARSW